MRGTRVNIAGLRGVRFIFDQMKSEFLRVTAGVFPCFWVCNTGISVSPLRCLQAREVLIAG